ncbi:MAG: hypothetical protein D3910_24485 [Candidatus Electrothrix sp. ATG2]|nr:hypothetical protein [Candidatus Electrothrix sp. ATG2]
MRIAVADSHKRLVTIWFSGSGFLFALLLLQTVLGKYGSEARDTWALMLPTFVPTLFLLLGTLIADVNNPKGPAETVTVDRFFFVSLNFCP